METHQEWIGGLKSRVSPLKSLVSPLNRGLGSATPGSDYATADCGDVPSGGDVQGGDLGRKAGIRTRKWPGAESNCRHADFQSAALPTELPGRDYAAEELSGLPDAVGVSLFAVICPFVCRW